MNISSNSIYNNKDVFDIFNIKEDGYTNLLKILFDTSPEFKKNFVEMIFENTTVSPDDFEFLTRRCFKLKATDNNCCRKIIPDIVLYNSCFFAIIEIKVNAGEGKDQTTEYYNNRDLIKDDLKIKNCQSEKFYYVTKYGLTCSSDKFNPLAWTDIAKCIPETPRINNLINNLALQLKRRINSLKDRSVLDSEKWINTMEPFLFCTSIKLHSALLLLPELNSMKEYSAHWECYETAEHMFCYSASFGKKAGKETICLPLPILTFKK